MSGSLMEGISAWGAAPLVVYRELKRWGRPSAGRRGVRVNYGLDALPGTDRVLSGGLVKCQDLQTVFPSCEDNPDLLYLVSSSLPPHFRLKAKVAQRRGGKIVLNQNGVAYPAWHGPGWEKTNGPLAWAHRSADYVIYQSDFCRRAAALFLGERRGDAEVLRNPVDTTRFVPSPRVREGGEWRLITGGSHHFFHRVAVAVEVLAVLKKEYPGMKLVVAGRCLWKASEAESRKELEALAESRGVTDAVECVGPYSQVDAVRLMQEADILIHTQYNDSCPRLVIEAMSCGLPVAYSSTGGTPELVGEEGGAGVSGPEDWEEAHPPDPEEMSEAVRRIIADYGKYSSGARRRAVELFDLQPWLKRHREIFRALTE